jgi:hypothetical protein
MSNRSNYVISWLEWERRISSFWGKSILEEEGLSIINPVIVGNEEMVPETIRNIIATLKVYR